MSARNAIGLVVPDGLSEIRQELPLVMRMIEQTARWVHPRTFRALPAWHPDTARGRPAYDAGFKHQRVSSRGRLKVEENVRAGTALVEALGVRPKPRNWTVCHIWGYDDAAFAGRSNVVQDARFYSCIGNMVWLPTPLKGFTDSVPEIKACLRTCAFHLYGWACEHDDVAAAAAVVRSGIIPEGYPSSWPTADRKVIPSGTAPYNHRVQRAIERRKAQISHQLRTPELTHYGHDAVRAVLDFWRIEL